ncbi:hypothetical protein, partial [[Clostridium] scindens]|uniref:hypothetical protein n=1 Tax=Clostridium scindens (strain JCM 10418 / VPI 12708) TaxID=29347 RepID=UPI003AA7DAC1
NRSVLCKKCTKNSKGKEEKYLAECRAAWSFLPDADREIDRYPNAKSAGKNRPLYKRQKLQFYNADCEDAGGRHGKGRYPGSLQQGSP